MANVYWVWSRAALWAGETEKDLCKLLDQRRESHKFNLQTKNSTNNKFGPMSKVGGAEIIRLIIISLSQPTSLRT